MPSMNLQYAIASFTAPSFAMYHVDAAQSALRCIMQKLNQQFSCRIGVEPMQIKFVLWRPFTPAQLAQRHAIQAGTKELGDRAIACAVIG